MKYVLLFFVIANTAFAQNIPQSYSNDNRLKEVTYRENDVIPIEGIPLTTTQIVLPVGESILDIEGGDTTAWMVTYHPNLPNIIFIKPTSLNSDSNMTVITNRHAYYFHLKSNKALVNKTYAIKINQSIPPKSSLRSIPPIKTIENKRILNTAYRFSGSNELTPLHVFDDGRFTYFEIAPNAPVPAIFAIDDKSGKENTVNTRYEGKYIVVLRLAPQFTLRSGGKVTSIFNDKEIARIKLNRRPQ